MTRPENDESREPTIASAGRDVPMEWSDSEIEDDVRSWTREPHHADLSLITRYLAGELSPADQMRVEHRLTTDPEFRALAEPVMMIWEVPGPLDREPSRADRILAERTWEKLEEWIELEQLPIHSPALEKKRAKRLHRLRILFTAILATIGAGLYELLRPPGMPVPVPGLLEHTDAPAYEKRFARLPDESQVTLLPGSRLSYSHLISSSYERTLNLDGEATFVVAPGPGALVVQGRGVAVIAPQGRFTVQARDGVSIAYVTVWEGMAQVRALPVIDYGESLTLHAGESVRVGPGERIERVDAPLAPSATSSESGGATTERATPPQDAFVRGPRALLPRGLALVDSIEHDFGERPRELAFTGKDTIDVTFWNPAFWRTDMVSKEFPQASLPLVRKAAEHVGGFVWTTYGRDAGIDVIRVTFVRMRRVNTAVMTSDVPAQEVTGQLTRKQLESGSPQLVSLTMSQR